MLYTIEIPDYLNNILEDASEKTGKEVAHIIEDAIIEYLNIHVIIIGK